jgi:hypothetical protein
VHHEHFGSDLEQPRKDRSGPQTFKEQLESIGTSKKDSDEGVGDSDYVGSHERREGNREFGERWRSEFEKGKE